MSGVEIPPVVKTLSLAAPMEKAFRHFTDNIHVWWPLASYSLSEANAHSVVFEARAGGRIYEIDRDGRERDWGEVLACDPPRRAVFTWVLEDLPNATEVEIAFRETAPGACEMTLIHRGWEAREDGAKWRAGYNEGWDGVLAKFIASLG